MTHTSDWFGSLSWKTIQRDLAILLVCAILVAFANIIWVNREAWDDAYITFRYSKNLAEGYGIVWNPGGEPTQGYTPFSFMILLSLGIRLGINPTIGAFALNTLGLIVTLFSFYMLTIRLIDPPPPLYRLLPPLAILFLPQTQNLLVSGMETIFWTGICFAGALLIMRFMQTKEARYATGSLIIGFLLCLTRPESVLIVGLWIIILFWQGTWATRKLLLRDVVIFTICGFGYMGWLYAYFGAIWPNAFYIKVGQQSGLPGLDYIIQFIVYYIAHPAFFLGLIGLWFLPRKAFPMILPFAATIILPIFYLFTQPIVGDEFRFLNPTNNLFTFILALGSIALALRLAQFIPPHLGRRVYYVHTGAMLLLIGTAFFYKSSADLFLDMRNGHYASENYTAFYQAARAIGSLENSNKMMIAYGDAGKFSYYTDSTFIDVVGLNNNDIAREGAKYGGEWVVDYALELEPDIIAFYTYEDGTIFNQGHGVIGSYYSYLYEDKRFEEHYQLGINFLNGIYILRWFVRKDSPHIRPFVEAMRPFHSEDAPPIRP